MRLLLHVEGAAVLALSLFFYGYSEFSWILFFILLLVPDVSMVGYLLNNKVGSILYNFFHTYTIPMAIITFGFIVSNQTVLAVGLIWSAHIGMDRMVGYGLKYPTEFKDTHLNRV